MRNQFLNRRYSVLVMLTIVACTTPMIVTGRLRLITNELTQSVLRPQPRAVLAGHKKRDIVFAFSPDGLTLATGADESVARLWDLRTGLTKAYLPGHRYVSWLSFSAD